MEVSICFVINDKLKEENHSKQHLSAITTNRSSKFAGY
jgi:hypothetical protein